MCGSFGSHGQEVFEWTGKGFLHLPLTAQTCFHCRTMKGKGHRGEERVTKSQLQTSLSKYFYGTGVAVTDAADNNLSDNLHKYMIRYKQLLQLLDQFSLLPVCLTIFRKQKRQRAQNATSVTVATSTAGTLSAATLFHHHDTAERIHSTAWTPSAHAHVRPRRQTSRSPAAAVMVWNMGPYVCVSHVLSQY